jgi:hypothetical protein
MPSPHGLFGRFLAKFLRPASASFTDICDPPLRDTEVRGPPVHAGGFFFRQAEPLRTSALHWHPVRLEQPPAFHHKHDRQGSQRAEEKPGPDANAEQRRDRPLQRRSRAGAGTEQLLVLWFGGLVGYGADTAAFNELSRLSGKVR